MAAAARERNATAKSGPVFRRRVTLVARLVDRAAGMALDTLMGVPRRARRLFVTVGVLVALVGLALAACTVKAPPAPQSTDTPRNSAPPPQRITQIIMGIDSIGAGFNPHLLSDLSPVNAAISALVLPSAFRPVPDPDTPTGSRWELDPTLVVSADVTNRGAMDGDEVVELYLTHQGVAGAALQELRGFQRIHLARGQTRTVSFSLRDRDLSVVDAEGKRRVVKGTIKAWIGGGQPAGPGKPATAGVSTQFSITSEKSISD